MARSKTGGLASSRPSAPKRVGSQIKPAGGPKGVKGSLKANLDTGAGLVPKLNSSGIGMGAGPMPRFQTSASPMAQAQELGEGQRVARAAGMGGGSKARSKPRMGKNPRTGR